MTCRPIILLNTWESASGKFAQPQTIALHKAMIDGEINIAI